MMARSVFHDLFPEEEAAELEMRAKLPGSTQISGLARRRKQARNTRGSQLPVTGSLAAEFAPDAAAFYPALPSRALRYRDLVQVSMVGLSGSAVRTSLLILTIGLLS